MSPLEFLVPVSHQAFLVLVSGLVYLVLRSHQVFQVPNVFSWSSWCQCLTRRSWC